MRKGRSAALARLTVLVATMAALMLGATASWAAGGGSGRCQDPGAAPRGSSLQELRATTLCLINRIRFHYGLEGLRDNSDLRRSASGHSKDMVAKGYFSHYGSSGGTLGGRVTRSGYLSDAGEYEIGENIGGGKGHRFGSPIAVVSEWMHSAPHRANLLDPDFRDSGLGIARGYPGGGGDPDAATYTLDLGGRD